MSSWLDNSNNSNCLISTKVEGFLDISGGNIITRNKDFDTISITGDVSLNQSTIFAATVDDTSVIVSKDNSSNFIDLTDNATLTPFGFDLSGTYPQSQSGHSMSKNYDGSIIALGASENSAGAGINRGIVRVYQKSDLSWVQLGGDLSGVLDNQHFGHSLDLNGDGTTLAVGTKDVSNNALYLYKYDGTTWNQHGNTIHVLSQSDLSFNSHSIAPSINVKLNKEGNKLVTSNKYYVTNTFTGQIATGSYSAPYSSIGAYHNFEFRRAGVTGSITDDMGGQSITFPGTLDATNGSVISSSQELRSTVTLSHPISVEVYFRLDGGDNGKALFHVDDDVMLTIYNGAIQFGVRHPSGTGYNYYQTPNPFSTNTWYHLVVTMYHNGSTANNQFEIQVYINGSHYGTQMTNLNYNDFPTGNKSLYMGRNKNTTGKFAGGYRYARVYHKKLSASEITQLYNERNVSTLHGTLIYGTGTVVKEYNEEIVQCYEYSDTSWNQLGNTIETSSLNDISGGDIAINDEGNMIAIGYPNYETESSYTYTIAANGVSAYTIDGVDNATITLYRGAVTNFNISASGHPFYIQTTSGAYNASSVYSQITDNGSQNANISFTLPDDAPDTLYYVCQYHSGMAGTINVQNKGGYTKVYKYDSSWNQVGSNIEAENSNIKSGASLVMDGSGDFVAIGAPAANSSAGKVSVYQNINDSWTKKGNDMEGASSNDEFGSAISMNASGDIMVVGAPNVESAKGKAYVHEYNVTDNSWNLKTSVTGTTANDKLGSSVRLNGLGTEVSVGEPGLTVSTPSYDWNFRQNTSSPIYDSISNSPATFSGITATTTNGVRTTGYIAMSPSTQGPSFSLEFYYYCHTNSDDWAGPTTYNFHLGFYSDTTNYDYFNWTQRGRYDAKNMFAIINYENGAYNYSDHQQYDSNMHPNIGVYHDVITMDGTNLIVYRNGNPVYTDTTWNRDFPTADMIYSTINTPHPSVNTSIAGTYHASSYAANLDLSVYSYRLWNNHALSASEVSTLYANRETSNYFSNVAKFRTFQMEHTQNFHNFKYLQVPTGRLSIGVENGTNMLDISGNVFISNDLTISDDLSLNNGTVFVHGDLSVNNVAINSAAIESISTSEINYNSDINFNKRLFVNANDISHNGVSGNATITELTINQDFTLLHYVEGENDNDYESRGVKISGDGNFFITGGENLLNTNGDKTGGIRYYKYDSTSNTYIKVSNTIYGPNITDAKFGGNSTSNETNAISYNGKTFASGAPNNKVGNGDDRTGNGTAFTGSVWIYMYDSTSNSWTTGNNNTPLTGPTDQSQRSSYLGANNSINKNTDPTIDGTFIVVSDNYAGSAVYKYSLPGGTLGGTWSQYGPTFPKQSGTTNYQCPNGINQDGTRIVFGYPQTYSVITNNVATGGFEVYEWSVSDNSWNQLGSRIGFTSADSEYFGRSNGDGITSTYYGYVTAMNAVGDIVAISQNMTGTRLVSDPSKYIYALVYKYDGSNWTLLAPVTGDIAAKTKDVALSASGHQVFIGLDTGQMYHAVFQYKTNTNTWELVTNNMVSELVPNAHGSVSSVVGDITSDGKRVIAGGVRSPNGSFRGITHVSNELSTTETINPTYQTHASDLASNGSFSSDIAFNHSLIVPGNMVIVDGSNKTTYGSYTTYTDPSGEKFFHAGKSASNVFNIVNQSNVGVYMASGQSTFSSTSDKKLKTNIQPLENSLKKIEKLNPVTYQWKENKKEDSGFIAQEVEEIMPELVEENETYNGEKQKGIKSSELIPFILESLNEIDKKLDGL